MIDEITDEYYPSTKALSALYFCLIALGIIIIFVVVAIS
jgi:hypothetical protein